MYSNCVVWVYIDDEDDDEGEKVSHLHEDRLVASV